MTTHFTNSKQKQNSFTISLASLPWVAKMGLAHLRSAPMKPTRYPNFSKLAGFTTVSALAALLGACVISPTGDAAGGSDALRRGGNSASHEDSTLADSTHVDSSKGVVKVDICHIPPGNPANAHHIRVGSPAYPAHLAHGDLPCVDSGIPDDDGDNDDDGSIDTTDTGTDSDDVPGPDTTYVPGSESDDIPGPDTTYVPGSESDDVPPPDAPVDSIDINS